jgi:hypothetical protein
MPAIGEVFGQPALQIRRLTEVHPARVGEDAIHARRRRRVLRDVREIQLEEVRVLPGHSDSR